MIKQTQIERLGVFSMNTTDKPAYQVDFNVKNTTPAQLDVTQLPIRCVDGNRLQFAEDVIERFVKLDLPGGFTGGFVNSSIVSSNHIVKNNYETYVKAVGSASNFYGKVLLYARDKFIDIVAKRTGGSELSADEWSKLAVSIDGMIHYRCNHFLADHLAEIFLRDKPRRFDNSIHSLNRYINGSFGTMHRLITVSNADAESMLQKLSWMDNPEVEFENNCIEFLLGQNLLHCIIVANMNYTLGKPKMTQVFSANWSSSKELLRKQLSEYRQGDVQQIAPDGENPNVYFGRPVWSRFTCNMFCQRLNELSCCAKAFVSLVENTIKSDNKQQDAQEALFNSLVDSMQLVVNLEHDDEFIDKIATDIADCLTTISVQIEQ